MNLREQIRAADDRNFEDVVVDEWGGLTVRVVAISAGEIIELADASDDGRKLSKGLLARALIDESGQRIYDDQSIDELFGKSMTAVDKLLRVARRLNGLDADTEKKDSATGGDSPTA